MQKNVDGFLELSRKNNYLDKTQEFIKKALSVHGTKYDYTKSVYEKSNKKLIITCPEHGDFFQTPNKHISGKTGCPTCARNKHKQISKNQQMSGMLTIIETYRKNYPQYQYSCDFDSKTIIVICSEHGTTKHKYISGNVNTYPCKLCGIKFRSSKLNKSEYEYIKQARALHGGVYDYVVEDKQIYMICKHHGKILLSKNRKSNHINRLSGCPKCKYQMLQRKYSKSNEKFIIDAQKVHGTKYDYTYTRYINTHTKIKIMCKKHGIFEQTPLNHLQGSGCPLCYCSYGEKLLEMLLTKRSITFEKQKTFKQCINPETGKRLRFDFFLPDYNTLIEIDGIQHFTPVTFSNNINPQEEFVKTQYRDWIKNTFALKYNYNLIRIPYTDLNNISVLLDEILLYNKYEK